MTTSIKRRVVGGAAAVGMVAGVALAGAGVAHAQTITYSSPSSMTLERDSIGRIGVSYDNRSGMSMECAIAVGNQSVVNGINSHLRSSGDPATAISTPESWPANLQSTVTQAIEAGEFNMVGTVLTSGYSGLIPGPEMITDFPMNTTFPLNAVSVCVAPGGYQEVERAGGGGPLGSVENLFGSAS